MSDSHYTPRVTQLDSLEFDKECYNIFKGQWTEATTYFSPALLDRLRPEIIAAMKTVVWLVPLCKQNTTLGQRLLGIKYASRRSLLYALTVILLPYVSERLSLLCKLFHVPNLAHWLEDWKDKLHLWVEAASFCNLLLFLRDGRYPTLSHRVLHLRMQTVNPELTRSLDYSYMTRELLWHSFAELLTFALPLINVHKLKRTVKQFLPSSASDTVNRTGQLTCILCEQSPILPQRIACSHTTCYYCIQAHLLADAGCVCPSCKEPAVCATPLNYAPL